ncbi:MAG: hypothetical protein RLZZ522_1441 [Verrucomicrobiota bacterium]
MPETAAKMAALPSKPPQTIASQGEVDRTGGGGAVEFPPVRCSMAGIGAN